jgi:SAM-dependent methyltransferase
VLGYAAAEQDRLLRQAALLAPLTERFFREAGIGPSQRVLDIGSGMGDVAQIAARLVGPTGRVVGVEQDAPSIARARQRLDASGFDHVTFVHADVNALPFEQTFDAVVGRFVLNHSRDVAALLRALTQSVRRGGVVAFQEVAFSPALAAATSVPLWHAVLGAIGEILRRSGLSPDLGLSLHRIFQQAGLSVPSMHLDIPFARDESVIRLEVDLLQTLRPAAERHRVSLTALGDFDTLVERIHAEALRTCSAIGFAGVVSAWSTVS